MHTKGEASKKIKEMLGLDICIYFGNDLNDITMFSNAIEDNDFIVIANNEYKGITEMLENYLKEECRIKGIEWESTKLLVLEDENVNSFLNKISKILGVLSSGKMSQNLRKKYRVDIKQQNRLTKQRKKTVDYKGKKHSNICR